MMYSSVYQAIIRGPSVVSRDLPLRFFKKIQEKMRITLSLKSQKLEITHGNHL